jgi:hypothetical protein
LTALTTCSGVSPFASSFVGSMSTMICRYFFAGRRRQGDAVDRNSQVRLARLRPDRPGLRKDRPEPEKDRADCAEANAAR